MRNTSDKKPSSNRFSRSNASSSRDVGSGLRNGPEKRKGRGPASPKVDASKPATLEIRLNRFIANAGICSRRDADLLIAAGRIMVNGNVETRLGTKVHTDNDKVTFDGKTLRAKQYVYILLNKPKNTIATTDDEKGRSTVIEIVSELTPERVYPVGRLDRNTTGLLLLTNDGDLAEKLTHPSHEIKKIYHVKLDKAFSQEDMIKLNKGFDLEDGFIKADLADYVTGGGPNEVGIVLHSGRNRLVRRMMEHLGYEVIQLDRTGYANLTKKNLQRGLARFLTPREIAYLKML